ncbi:LamB/YcsF family protein [Kocuria sp. CPCC 205263]|uniref:LamB/YcsF family protein n=1 Tax=Kocuria sp. CPCC 205263 TaxID=3073555 RepID=UPI0034D578CE
MPPSDIDLNADCGESLSAWAMAGDEAVLHVVTSANVACGFHAGDPTVARRTCTVAAEQGVAVGAQVSYDDLKGFGRRFIAVPRAELTDQLVYQIGALQALARASGTGVSYVKPHGALYNAIVHHEEHAGAVVDAVRDVDDALPLLVLPGSEIERQARAAGLRTVREAFADRGYTAQATLVPRTEAGAVLHDADEIAARVVRMAVEGVVEAVDGSLVAVDVQSICVHGDTPGALAIAERVRRALEEAGLRVGSFL